jgi:hypothetical protein
VILDSMRADGGAGTSCFSQAVLSPSSLYLYSTIVLCFFNFCVRIAVDLCLCSSLRSFPMLILAIFSCAHTYAVFIANPVFIANHVLLHSDPFWCFLHVDPLGCFLHVDSLGCFLHVDPLGCFLHVDPLGCFLHVDPLGCFLHVDPLGCFLHVDPLGCFLHLDCLWCFLRLDPLVVT